MKSLPLSGKEILVIEDEILFQNRLTAYLKKQGASTVKVDRISQAEKSLEVSTFDFVLMDINLPDGNGLELLRKDRFVSHCGVVVMTADGGIKSAVEAMKLGADDYLVKPFDFDELPIVFDRISERLKLKRAQEHNREKELKSGDSFFFGSSLADLKTKLEKIIKTDTQLQTYLPPVLISGETGSGKSSIARWLHHKGPRHHQPLIEVNCSTLSENLAESELFGHERGAFTDAKQGRIGLFEAANKGTLFLDEISSLSPYIQSKVLTAIEDHQIRRVGGTKMIDIDARIITASLHDLSQRVSQGLFREDLYYRLDLLRIHILPLRERGEDVLKLACHVLENLCQRYGKIKTTVSSKGKKRLLSYPWPGNVRELKHELERALILGDDGPLDFNNLDLPKTTPSTGDQDSSHWLNPLWSIPEEGFFVEEAVNQFIQLALDQTNNNVSAAARLLNVPRDYIRYRLKNQT